MSDEAAIQAEVQRRVAAITVQKNQEIAELRNIIGECQDKLIQQQHALRQLTSEPVIFSTVLDVNQTPDPASFRPNDEVVVVCDYPGAKTGKIISGLIENQPVIDADGRVLVKLSDDREEFFGVGLPEKAPMQVRLTKKTDGTFAVLSVDGKAWEVKGVPDLDLKVGETVKIRPDNKAIISKADIRYNAGPVCHVIALTPKGVEVLAKGEVVQVFNPHAIPLEEGDRVLCDSDFFCVLEKLPQDSRERYKVSADLKVDWDDIGGLSNAKQELRDALELPYQYPDLFTHYNVEALRGFLIYGPPGCGKTLLARAAAVAVAKQHGKEAIDSGYIYVKSPEILDKWVGNSEAEIRALFERGRKHFRDHGYKAILVFDEADAIMPQRGSRRSSDIADTLVPMFLGEMDGLDTEQTAANPIIVLLTNRADILDPAVTRPGRISKHIKVDRPTDETAMDIFEIHTQKLPFAEPEKKESILAIATSELFSQSRTLYTVNGKNFCLGDAVNGAMIEALVESTKMLALHRDIKDKTCTGVTTDDFRKAVAKLYDAQRGLNHTYDVQDFAEKHQMQPNNLDIKRSFGSA